MDKTRLTEDGRRAEGWRDKRQGSENSASAQEEQKPVKTEKGFGSLVTSSTNDAPNFCNLPSILPIPAMARQYESDRVLNSNNRKVNNMQDFLLRMSLIRKTDILT